MGSNDRWMKTGTFEFYEKIQECLELDFDLNQLKYDSKRASLFERICWCITCCFPCKRNKTKAESMNKLEREKKTPRHISQRYYVPTQPVRHPSLSEIVTEEIEMTNMGKSDEEDNKSV
jgi:hypothetical protein